MSSIDERVVEMRFDNAQFERGVKQTLSSLDKLKEGLKFDGALNGLNLLQNGFNGLKLTGINKSMDQLNNKFSAMGIAGMEVVKRVTNAALDATKRVVTAIPNQIKNGGWSRAMNLEKAQFQLEGVGVKWKEVSNDISYAVNQTSYGLDEAARMAGQLAASGVKVGGAALNSAKDVDVLASKWDNVGDRSHAAQDAMQGDLDQMAVALRAISGVAAMTGSSYSEIGQIFTRVAGQGRVFATDLNSIAVRGLNATSVLSKQLGKSEAEVKDMVSKGEIDFNTFSTAMYNAFANQATKANDTFDGALANMKASLSRIGADVADDIIPAATKVFNSLRGMFNAVHKWIQPVLDSLGRLATAIGDTLSPIIDNITSKISKLTGVSGGIMDQIASVIDKITGKVNKIKDGILKAMGIETQEEAQKAAAAVEKVGVSLEHIDEMAHKVIRGDFGNQPVRQKNLEAIGESYERIQNRVNELLGCSYRYKVAEDAVATTESKAAEETRKAVENAKQLADVRSQLTKNNWLKGFANIGETFKIAFSQIGSSVKKVFSGFAKDFAGLNWLKISHGFEQFTGAIVNSESNIAKFRTVIDDIVSGIGNLLKALGQVATAFGKAFIETLQEINGQDPTKMSGAFKELTDNLVLTKDGAEGLKDVFKALMSPLKVIVPLIQTVGTALLKIASAAAKVNSKFLEFIGKSKVLQSLQKVIEKIGEALKKIWDGFKNSEGFQKLVDAAGKLKDALGDKLSGALDTVAGKLAKLGSTNIQNGSGLDRIITTLSNFASGLSKVLDGITNLVTGKINFGDVLTKMFQGIGKGLSVAIGSIPVLGKGLMSMFKGIGNFFAGGGFSKFKEQGFKGAFKGMFSGMTASIGTEFNDEMNKNGGTLETIKGYAESVGDVLKNFGKTIKEKVSSVNWSGIGKSIQSGFGTFVDNLSKIFLDKRFQTLFKTITSMARDIAAIKALSAAGDMMKSFAEGGKKIGESVSGFFKQLSSTVKDLENLAKMKAKIGMFKDIGKTILMLVGAMAAISLIEKYGDLKTSLAVITGLVASLSALFITIGKINLNVANISAFGHAMTALGVAILAMIGSLAIVAHMNADMYRTGIGRLIALVGSLVILVGVMNRISGAGGGAIKTSAFITLAVAINLLLIPLKVLANMDADAYNKGVLRLIAILGSLTVAVSMMSWFSSAGTIKTGNFLALSVAILALTASLKSLAKLDTETLIRNAASLSGVLLALGGALRLASTIKFGGIAGMVVAIASVTAALLLLEKGPKPESLMSIATGMSALFIALGISFSLLESVSWKSALGQAVAMGVAVNAIGVALYALESGPNPDSVLPIAEGLSVVLMATAAAIRVMQGIDFGAAVKAGAGIGAAFDVFTLLIEGLVELNGVFAKIPGFEKTFDDGMRILKKLGTGLGDALGGFVGSFAGSMVKEGSTRINESMDAITSIVDSLQKISNKIQGTDFGATLDNVKNLKKTLKELGKLKLPEKFGDTDKLSEMKTQMSGLTEFIRSISSSVRGIDDTVVNKLTTLSDSMTAISDFVTMTSSIDTSMIQTNLSDLQNGMNNLQSFVDTLKDLKIPYTIPAKVENLTSIIQSFEPLKGTGDSWGGLDSLFTGFSSLTNSSSDLVTGMTNFSTFIDQLKTMKIPYTAPDKAQLLAETVSQLDGLKGTGNDLGGLKSLWSGISSLTASSEDLVTGMGNFGIFVDQLKTMKIPYTAPDKANLLATTVKQFQGLESTGNDLGGLKSLFSGISSLTATSEDLTTGMGNFSLFVDQLKTMKIPYTAPNKASLLADTVKAISGADIQVSSGISNFFHGLKSFKDSAKDISGWAGEMQTFVSNINGIDGLEDAQGKLDVVVGMLKRVSDNGQNSETFGPGSFSGISALVNNDTGGFTDLNTFVEKAVSFGEKLSGVGEVNTDNFDNLMDALNSIAELGASFKDFSIPDFTNFGASINTMATALTDKIASIDTSKIETFKSGIQSLAQTDTTGLADVATQLSDFATNGIKAFTDAFTNADVTGAVNGFTSKVNSVLSTGMESAKSTASDKGFDIGHNLATGLGKTEATVRNNANTVAKAAIDKIGEIAEQATQKGTDLGNKFASGIRSAEDAARGAAYYLASQAEAGLQNGGTNAHQWGYDLGANFAQGIRDSISLVAAAAQELAATVAKYDHNTTPDAGPMKDNDVWGLHLGQNFANGMIKSIPLVKEASLNLAKAVSEPMQESLLTTANNTFAQLMAVQKEAEAASEKQSKSSSKKHKQTTEETINDIVTKYTSGSQQVQKITKDTASGVKKTVDKSAKDTKDTTTKTTDQMTITTKKTGEKIVEFTIDAADKEKKTVDDTGKDVNEKTKTHAEELKETAQKTADDIYKTVVDSANKTTQAQEKTLKKATQTETNYIKALEDNIKKKRDAEQMSYTQEAALWSASLSHISKDSEAYVQVIQKRDEAVVNSWSEQLEYIEKFMDVSKSEEYSYWTYLASQAEKGSKAQEEATKKSLEARKGMIDEFASSVKETTSSLMDTMTSLTSEFKLSDDAMTFDQAKANMQSASEAAQAAMAYMDIIQQKGIKNKDLLKELWNLGLENVGTLASFANQTPEALKEYQNDFEKSNAIATQFALEKSKSLIGNFGVIFKNAFDVLGDSVEQNFPGIAQMFADKSANMLGDESKEIIDTGLPQKVAEFGDAMVRSFAENMIPTLSSINDNLSETLSQMIPDSVMDLLKMFIQNLAPNLPQFVNDLKEMIASDTEGVFPDAITELLGILNDGIIAALPDVLPDFLEQFKETLFGIMQEGLADDLSAIAEILAPAVIAALPDFMDAIKEGLGEFFSDYLTENMEGIFEWLAELLSETLPDILPDFFEMLGDDLGDVFGESLGPIIESMFMADKIKESLMTGLQTVFQYATQDPGKKFWNMFFQLGVYLMEGLIAGIMSKKQDVANAVADVVSNAHSAGMAAAQAHSPSKLFAKLGGFMGEGLVIGMNDWAGKVANASSDLADNAATGFNSVSSMMASALATDINTAPRITPVLDLSQVQSQAGYLNSMFASEQAMSVAADMNAYNQARQNGSLGGVTNNTDNSIGNINMSVYGAPGQDPNAIADQVISKINKSITRRGKVYA